MRRWRREILFLAVSLCLSASSRATPVDDSKTPLPAERPAFRSAINVVTTTEAKPSFFVSPPPAPTPEFPSDSGKPTLAPANAGANSSSGNGSLNSTIQSELAGPTAGTQSPASLTDSSASAVPPEETTNGKTTGTSGREFSLTSQGTPEPGSLGLIACGGLLLLRRARPRAR
jgi:hypothetical protein